MKLISKSDLRCLMCIMMMTFYGAIVICVFTIKVTGCGVVWFGKEFPLLFLGNGLIETENGHSALHRN
jgi:hypothetical protein